MTISIELSLTSMILYGAPKAAISITSGSGYSGSVYTSTVSDQWYADDVAISGETGLTWTMTTEYEGAAIRCGDSNTIEMLIPSDLGVSAFDSRQGLTLSGSSVAQWDTSDGLYTGTQGTASNQPTYNAAGLSGGPAVTFDGTDSLDAVGMSTQPSSRSVVAVLSFDSDLSRAMVFGPSASGGYLFRRGVSNNLEIVSAFTSVLASSSSNVATGSPLVLGARITESSDYDFRDGGVSIGSGTASGGFSGVAGSMRIGKQNTDQDPMDGAIAFLASIDTYMSGSDIEKLEGIAAHITGTTGSLDASHPYKSTAPMVTA